MALQDTNFYNTNPGTEDYLNKSFAATMIRYAPNGTAPLFGLTSMMGTGTCTATEHGYFAKTMIFPSVVLDGAVADGTATSFTVVSTTNILAGDLLRAQTTGEIVRVMAVVDGTTLTVMRQVGQVVKGAIADGVALYGVGNAHEQASLRPASRLMNPVRVINFTQIFRNSWALPKTVSVIAPIVGDSLTSESRTDCAMLHSSDIEKSLIFGQKSGLFVNSQYMTTMDGLIESVRRLAPAENTNTAGATTNYAQLEAMVNPVFNTINNGRNGNERTLLVGGQARTVINDIGRKSGVYQIVDGQTSFGLSFSTFKTSRGVFHMIEHPLFNSNSDWSKMAIAVDLGSLKICYLTGRQTENIEYGMDGKATDDGIDAVGGTLTSELTLENVNPAAHAVIFGLTAGAAEV